MILTAGDFDLGIVFIRTIIIFVSLIVLMRIMGNRQLGELELSELVVSVLIADLASLPLQDIGIPLMNGLLSIVVLFLCELIVSGITLRSLKMRVLICGKPCLLVENGKIVQREMRRCRFSVDELTEELRNQSITDISTVQYAVLETDGTLNAILIPAERPVTASQMNIQAQDTGYPVIVINDGNVLSENLKHTGRDMRWLEKEIQKRGLQSARQVYLMTVNSAGQIYFAAKEA